MRKIIVDSIQTSSGTAFDVFESQGSGAVPVLKDSADGILKNAVIPSDIKKVHEGNTGTAASSFEISIRRSNNSLINGFTFDISANDHSMFTSPVTSAHRELRFKLKDASGNFLTGSQTACQKNHYDNNWSGDAEYDTTTRDYAALRTGYTNHSVYNSPGVVDVTIFQDPFTSSRHYLSLRWRGIIGSSGSSSRMSVYIGSSFCRYDSGTPAKLVIQTNASVGNNEESFYANNITGYLP